MPSPVTKNLLPQAIFAGCPTRSPAATPRTALAGGRARKAPLPFVIPRAEAASFEQKGEASWYGPGFHGRRTASGETFDQNDLTAAHRTLPLGTKAEVTDVETGKSVEVTINDRGPYVKDRVIDLSKAAAQELGMTEEGTTTVKIEADPPRTPQAGEGDARNGSR